MKKFYYLLALVVFLILPFADEPTLDEINHATELFQQAGNEFDQAQALYTEANAVLSKVDAGEDVPIEQINEASDKFNKASEIFSKAEQDYKEANKILNVTAPEEPPQSTTVSEEGNATQESLEETPSSEEPYLLYISHYGVDKYKLRKDDKNMIEESVISLGDPTILHFYIYGHTDDTYTEYYNLLLSIKRAKAVRDYLIKLGVPEENIVIRGYGEKKPLADNKTDEGRAKNRRVEIYIK